MIFFYSYNKNQRSTLSFLEFLIVIVRLCGAQFCLIWFDDPTRIILCGFLMRDLPWTKPPGGSGGNAPGKIFWTHLAHCGTAFCNQGFLVWCCCRVFIQRENIVVERSTLYSSLIIVISLQLCERRQIAEPCKYCLVRVIVFL